MCVLVSVAMYVSAFVILSLAVPVSGGVSISESLKKLVLCIWVYVHVVVSLFVFVVTQELDIIHERRLLSYTNMVAIQFLDYNKKSDDYSKQINEFIECPKENFNFWLTLSWKINTVFNSPCLLIVSSTNQQ